MHYQPSIYGMIPESVTIIKKLSQKGGSFVSLLRGRACRDNVGFTFGVPRDLSKVKAREVTIS